MDKQAYDTSNSCWREIPLNDSNEHRDNPASCDVAATPPSSSSVKAEKETQEMAKQKTNLVRLMRNSSKLEAVVKN